MKPDPCERKYPRSHSACIKRYATACIGRSGISIGNVQRH